MYFYEVLEKCNLELVIREFLSFCIDSPDIQVTKKRIRNAIGILSETQAIISDTNILIAENVRTENGVYDHVYNFDTSIPIRWGGIDLTPWASTLGYVVDEKSLSIYGNERFVALVLWEMTWFGYDEDSIQEEVDSWGWPWECCPMPHV